VARCIVLWTNETRATIVSIADGAEEILHLDADARGLADSKARHPLREHCRNVVRALVDAQSIFIFGTARAKLELQIQMRNTAALRDRVVGTELKDSMTDVDLLARAREVCWVDRG
jgi:hypothetical protein